MSDKIYRSESWLREQYIGRGRSTRDIAGQVGCDQATILYWLDKHDIPKRSQGRGAGPDVKWKDSEWLKEQYIEKRRPATDIADECGIASQSLYYWMDRFGIERDATRYGHNSRVEYATYYVDNQGYPRWQSKARDGDGRVTDNFHVHRLLAIAVYGTGAVGGKDVHHRNGVPWDNRPENIELLDPGEHSSKHRRAAVDNRPVWTVG